MSLRTEYLNADRSHQRSSPHAMHSSYKTSREQSSCYDRYTQYSDTQVARPLPSAINIQSRSRSRAQSRSPRPRASRYEKYAASKQPQEVVTRSITRNNTWPKAVSYDTLNPPTRETQYLESHDKSHRYFSDAVAGPKRKWAAFVKEEELNCMLEDRAGTPHISELGYDEEALGGLNVEELCMAGAAQVSGGIDRSAMEFCEEG